MLVFSRDRRKTEVNRCYRGLGFGHTVSDFGGPGRSRYFWRYGSETTQQRPVQGSLSANFAPQESKSSEMIIFREL